jgi:hypothetical protein
MIPLSEAAERTGKTKQAIRKAVAAGRVRGEKDQLGQWLVDPASLFAVYQPVGTNQANHANQVDGVAAAEIEGLRRLVALLESERDDLRRRLDAEGEERRKLTAMLTDQRSPWWWWFAPRSGAQRRT